MEGDHAFDHHHHNGTTTTTQLDGKVVQSFQKSFGQVQGILDHNRMLIKEINKNHESKIPDNLTRNVGLIRELNNNIRKVVDLYADLSTTFSKSMDHHHHGNSSEGDYSSGAANDLNRSDGKSVHKRIRNG